MAIGRPPKFDSEELLDRAVDLIWREGPLALSLNEIAAELGTTKPALARRFGGKEDFLTAVLQRYHDRMDEPVREALANAETTKDVADAYLGAYLGALSEKPVGPATGCLLAAATEAFANKGATAIGELTRNLNQTTRRSLVDALTRTGAKDVERTAQFLYGQSVALAFLSRNGADAHALRAFKKRALLGLAE